ncbi:MAG: hypothetical protein IJZ44_03690 [Lachnospiraceae bacterium]|nr:hypothetical protein [Lachnospiraceae bacterium]
MKLKYYMRGVGIGIVVTALLMGFAISKQKEPMSDEEIRQRALEMGMIEQNGVLADDLGNKQEHIADVSANEPNIMTEEPDIAVEEPEILVQEPDIAVEEPEILVQEPDVAVEEPEILIGEPEEVTEEITEEETEIEDSVTVEEFVVVTVNGGDGSRTVANKLQKAGLVEDAVAYDAYLCQNGYDKRIATGNHEIPMGASEEEIAKEITTRKN